MNIEVKVALDNKPILGIGPLPESRCATLREGLGRGYQKMLGWILLMTTCVSDAALLFVKEHSLIGVHRLRES